MELTRQSSSSRAWHSRKATIGEILHIDPILFTTVTILVVIGLFVLYSASNKDLSLVIKQSSRIGIGFLLMLIVANIHPLTLKRWTPWLYGIGITLLLGVIYFGTGAKGAQRWLTIPGVFSFQPSELIKIVMPLMITWYLCDRAFPPKFLTTVLTIIFICIPVILIAMQPDLGTALLIASSGFIVLLLAGLPVKLLLILGLCCIPLATIFWFFFMHDYQQQRVLTFLNPERDPLGAGWNIIQSKTAIGSGGIHGKGWLSGTQSHLDFLPESSTDFIIAVLAEEFGFIGVCILMALYLIVIWRGLFIAWQAQDSYSRLLVGTFIFTFFVYIFVNIGMVCGLLPVVGAPLPLISYGGTAAISLLVSFGIVMSIHTHPKVLSK